MSGLYLPILSPSPAFVNFLFVPSLSVAPASLVNRNDCSPVSLLHGASMPGRIRENPVAICSTDPEAIP